MRDIVNTSGTALDHVVYDSYGNVVTETNASNGDRFKYAGMEYDSVTGQYYDRARYYDAAIGRFMDQDPMGFDAGDADLYRYVNNECPNRTDPAGLYGEPQPPQGPGQGGQRKYFNDWTRQQQDSAAAQKKAKEQQEKTDLDILKSGQRRSKSFPGHTRLCRGEGTTGRTVEDVRGENGCPTATYGRACSRTHKLPVRLGNGQLLRLCGRSSASR